MNTVMVIVGTVPEAVKLAPVCQALRHAAGVSLRVILTGQHRDRVAGILQLFGVRACCTLEWKIR
jgi:UDP-N-acetylglucosamine 2-epimerase (non-hydrolysing)